MQKEKQFIKEGRLYDISKARGLISGVKIIKEPYIGNQCLMYKIMTNLIHKNHFRHLCHITGKVGVGKTRLMNEVARYLHRRHSFTFKI